MQEHNGLKKVLGRWDSVAIIIAIVIGVGIFRVPSRVVEVLPYPKLVLLAWLIGGVISLVGALCYAELSSAYPVTGGNYIYLCESYGKWAGFLFGWTEMLVIHTGSIAAVAFICAEYMISFFSFHNISTKELAVIIVLILSGLNILGLRLGTKIQNTLTLAKIISIMAIIFVGFSSGRGNISHFSTPAITDSSSLSIFSSFGLALVPILWSYGGWHENTYVAGETKDASTILPFALITGITVVTVLYIVLNFLYIYIIPITEISKLDLIGSEILRRICGTAGKQIFEFIVVLSALAGINGMIITGSRITYAVSRDNKFLSYLQEINPRFKSPYRAIVIYSFWSILLILFGTFDRLLYFTGILTWLFFAMVGVGLFILRKRYPSMRRPYKVWGYPIAPAVFVGVSILLFINTLIYSAVPSIIGLGILLSGLPIYLISKKV